MFQRDLFFKGTYKMVTYYKLSIFLMAGLYECTFDFCKTFKSLFIISLKSFRVRGRGGVCDKYNWIKDSESNTFRKLWFKPSDDMS